MNVIAKYSSLFLIFALCSCGTSRVIDEKYAADLVKNKLSLAGNVTAKKLSGGFGGTMNFLVSDGQKKYVARFFTDGRQHESEIYNFNIASDEGYGPHVYFSDPSRGLVIMEYLSGKTITPQDLQSDQIYVAMAHLLQKIHTGKAFKDSGFDVFKRIDRAIKITKPKYNDSVPLEKVERVIMVIHQALLPHLVTTVPCHNDLHGGNWIFTGSEFKAFDYGDAAPRDPYFDVATVLADAPPEVTPARENVLLSTYLGRQPSDKEKAKLYLMKQVVLIKWAFDELKRLKTSPETIRQYGAVKVEKPHESKLDLSKAEDNLKHLKMLLEMVFTSFESQEFKDAVNTLK